MANFGAKLFARLVTCCITALEVCFGILDIVCILIIMAVLATGIILQDVHGIGTDMFDYDKLVKCCLATIAVSCTVVIAISCAIVVHAAIRLFLAGGISI